MSDRITQKDLDQLRRVLNRTINGDANLSPGRVSQDEGDERATYHANIGAYYIDGAYGGVALYRMVTDGGGVTDVFNAGHMPRRELYNRIRAFLDGYEAATREN